MDADKEARADHNEAVSVADQNLKEVYDASNPPFTPEEERKVVRKYDQPTPAAQCPKKRRKLTSISSAESI